MHRICHARRLSGHLQYLPDPLWQSWAESVVHPLATAFVLDQAKIPKLTQVARDQRLRLLQRFDELTDAQLSFTLQQQQA